MSRIIILSGTDRPDSRSLKVARYVKSLYDKEGVETEVVSLEDFPIQEAIGGNYGKSIPKIDAFGDKVVKADGIVMVVPEYNGSFPGILKLFIDYLPFPEAFDKRPIAFIGDASGRFGALRAVEQMQMVCGYRKAYIYPERVFIHRIPKIFNEEEGVKDDKILNLIRNQVTGFVRFVGQIRELESV